MSLHAEKVQTSKGITYRIRYWDNNQHKTLPLNDHPTFNSIEDARKFCKVQNAKADAYCHIEKHAKGKDALEWKKKYANLNQEVTLFIEWFKDEAPNSWEASRNWLQHYVLPYFLGKELNNPNLWHTEFETFRKWLEKEALTKNGKKLSYSSMGHVIKALSSYLKYLGLHSKMDIAISQVKCRGFKRSLSNKRGKDDLVKEAEYEKLKTLLGTSREFFIVLMNTGMRINELYSLQFANVFIGTEDLDESLVKPFEQLGCTFYGYIRLESQMKVRYSFRDAKTGIIKRKPLKSKPKISPEYNRVIPITDVETWEALVQNRRRAFKDWESRSYLSSNPDDYLLFNVDMNEIRRDISIAADIHLRLTLYALSGRSTMGLS